MVKVSDLCICEKLDFPRLSLYNYLPRRTTLSSDIETNKCCSLTSLLTSLWSSLPSSSSCHHLTLSTPSILCSVQGWRLPVQSLATLAVRAQDGVLYQPTVGRRGKGNDGGGDCAYSGDDSDRVAGAADNHYRWEWSVYWSELSGFRKR